MWKNWFIAFKVKVTAKGQNVDIYPDIFKTAEHFATKLGIVMHHNGLECQIKRFVCYFQGQGHSKGSYEQNMTVSTVSSELLILFYKTWFDGTLS